MATPRKEPQTEKEAQDLKRFLERGAEVSLEVQRTVKARQVGLPILQVAPLAFPVDVVELVETLAEDERIYVELEFTGVDPTSDAPVLVYLGQPPDGILGRTRGGADNLIGAVAWFGGHQKGHGAEQPVRVRLDATAAVRAAGGRIKAADIVLVPDTSERKPDRSEARVTAATIEVLKSTVKERS